MNQRPPLHAPGNHKPGLASTSRRRWLERGWIAATVGYGLGRVLLANRFLAAYGLNTVLFALVELSSSLAFGFASARFCRHVAQYLRQRGEPSGTPGLGNTGARATAQWGVATLVGYAAPDAFAVGSTHHVPRSTLIIIGCIISVSALVTSFSLLRAIKANRRSSA